MTPEVELDDLEYLVPNVTKLVRRVLHSIDRHFPTSDEAVANYLLTACRNWEIVSLTQNVFQFCDRYGGRLPGTTGTEGSARYVRNWLLTARTLADLAARAQASLPNVAPGKHYELVLYVSRVVHDASVGSTERVQELLPEGVVATPYGLIEQGEERRARAQQIRQDLCNGRPVPVFRVVSAYGNHLHWSPLWTLGNPAFDLIPETELEPHIYGEVAPPARLLGTILIVRGQVAPKARFVVERRIAYAPCEGGPDTLITTFDGVELDQSAEVSHFVRNLVLPARIGAASDIDAWVQFSQGAVGSGGDSLLMLRQQASGTCAARSTRSALCPATGVSASRRSTASWNDCASGWKPSGPKGKPTPRGWKRSSPALSARSCAK